MRRHLYFAVVMIMCLIMSSCESQNVKDAKEAFENEDYAKAVESLEKEENLNDKYTEMLHISRAHVAMDNKEPVEALKEIMLVENASDQELYSEARDSIVSNAIKNSKTKILLEALEVDPEIIPYAADEAIKACDNLEYGGFVVIQKLKKAIDDGEIKDKLTEYYDQNKLNKPKAFLLGKWENAEEDTSIKNIEIKQEGEGLIGIVTDTYREPFLDGDVYWKDFAFIDADQFTCESLTKGESSGESSIYGKGVGTINYKKGTIKVHHTLDSEIYVLSDFDSNWKKSK